MLLANAAAEARQASAPDLKVSVQAAALQLCPVAQICSNWVPGCSDVEDPQKDLVDPALKGTRNVMNAAVKSKATVKRVVLTSSFAGGAVSDCVSTALLCLETEEPSVWCSRAQALHMGIWLLVLGSSPEHQGASTCWPFVPAVGSAVAVQLVWAGPCCVPVHL